jgi:chromosome segregation ATPase
LPVVFSTKADALKASQDNLVEIVQQTQNIIDHSFSDFFHAHDSLTAQVQILLGHRDDIAKQIKSLPESLAPSTKALEAQQADFLNKIRSLPDISELQNNRSDLQQQLLKARHNHGQVRSEKDHLQDKLTLVEADRERLRAEVQLLKSTAGEHETEHAASTARISAFESNLQDALTRVSTAEAVNQALRQQIISLESNQRELQKSGNERSAKVCTY